MQKNLKLALNTLVFSSLLFTSSVHAMDKSGNGTPSLFNFFFDWNAFRNNTRVAPSQEDEKHPLIDTDAALNDNLASTVIPSDTLNDSQYEEFYSASTHGSAPADSHEFKHFGPTSDLPLLAFVDSPVLEEESRAPSVNEHGVPFVPSYVIPYTNFEISDRVNPNQILGFAEEYLLRVLPEQRIVQDAFRITPEIPVNFHVTGQVEQRRFSIRLNVYSPDAASIQVSIYADPVNHRYIVEFHSRTSGSTISFDIYREFEAFVKTKLGIKVTNRKKSNKAKKFKRLPQDIHSEPRFEDIEPVVEMAMSKYSDVSENGIVSIISLSQNQSTAKLLYKNGVIQAVIARLTNEMEKSQYISPETVEKYKIWIKFLEDNTRSAGIRSKASEIRAKL